MDQRTDPCCIDILLGEPAQAIHARLLAQAERGFGGAALVEKDGAIVLQAGYGYANREQQWPFTAKTVAQIGSITKQFTAMAVVDLWRQGRLDFADPLSKHLPDLPAQAQSLTIHQLLTHTAGLADYSGDDFASRTREQLLTQALAVPLLHAPGAKRAYSNMGYSVLGALVEICSGTSLEDSLRRRFFEPLGMERTGYLLSDVPAEHLATGYQGGQPQGVISEQIAALHGDYWNLKGNGGMQSTLLDMHRWYRALAEGPVISDEMRAVVLQPYAPEGTGGYGYGWFVHRTYTGELGRVSHAGSDGVFWSAFVWLPAARAFVYLVTNSDVEAAQTITREIIRVVG